MMLISIDEVRDALKSCMYVCLQNTIVWSSDADCHQIQGLHLWLFVQLNPRPNGVSNTCYFAIYECNLAYFYCCAVIILKLLVSRLRCWLCSVLFLYCYRLLSFPSLFRWMNLCAWQMKETEYCIWLSFIFYFPCIYFILVSFFNFLFYYCYMSLSDLSF